MVGAKAGRWARSGRCVSACRTDARRNPSHERRVVVRATNQCHHQLAVCMAERTQPLRRAGRERAEGARDVQQLALGDGEHIVTQVQMRHRLLVKPFLNAHIVTHESMCEGEEFHEHAVNRALRQPREPARALARSRRHLGALLVGAQHRPGQDLRHGAGVSRKAWGTEARVTGMDGSSRLRCLGGAISPGRRKCDQGVRT